MGGRAERIVAALRAALSPLELSVQDESTRHAGHAGAAPGGETHYAVRVVSEAFHGQARVERYRLVHEILRPEFDSGLHALSLTLRAPGEQP